MPRFAYVSKHRFLDAPELGPEHRFGVAGLAYDGATTLRPGARLGPREIRAASHQLCDGTHPLFSCSPLGQLGDAGDLELPNTDLASVRQAIERQAAALLSAHHMVWLGGDHSVTLSLLRAYRAHLGQPLAVVHFDAHCDTWTDHFGEPSGHGTWVHEAFAEGLVVPGCFTQIGIRSAAEPDARDYVVNRGGLCFAARSLRGRDSPDELEPVLAAIADRQRAHGHPPLYLSLDIDCLDPAFAPGTGTPEPGGLNTGQLLSLIEGLVALGPVGMDCVEVSPPFDHAEITSLAACHAVWTYLSGLCATRP